MLSMWDAHVHQTGEVCGHFKTYLSTLSMNCVCMNCVYFMYVHIKCYFDNNYLHIVLVKELIQHTIRCPVIRLFKKFISLLDQQLQYNFTLRFSVMFNLYCPPTPPLLRTTDSLTRWRHVSIDPLNSNHVTSSIFSWSHSAVQQDIDRQNEDQETEQVHRL